MDAEDRFYDEALERVAKAILAIAAGGAVALWVWRGWKWGAGFAVGAIASWFNYRWLKNIVDALSGRKPTRKRVAVIAGLRYLLLGGGAYVIVRYSQISVSAALLGLFVSVAAVILEIIFQLIYARK
jgi:hypothetical protein